MRKLVSKAKMSYGRKSLKVGDEFEASDQDAKLLVLIGRAEYPPEPVVRRRRAYRRRDMRAEASPVIAPE